MSRMARATCAASPQATYSNSSGSRRWSISSSRPSRQRSVSTFTDSDYPIVAAIHRHLSRSSLGEQRPAHLGGQFGDVAAPDLGLKHIVGLVLLYRKIVVLGPLRQHLVGPDTGVEHGVRVQGVDAYPVRPPFQ